MSHSALLQVMDDNTRAWAYESTLKIGVCTMPTATPSLWFVIMYILLAASRESLPSSSVSVIGIEVPVATFVSSNSDARAFVQLFNTKYDKLDVPWKGSRFNSLALFIADGSAKTKCIYVGELGAATATTPRQVSQTIDVALVEAQPPIKYGCQSICEVADGIAQVLHLLKYYIESGQYKQKRLIEITRHA